MSLPAPGSLMMVDLPGPELDAETREHLERWRVGAVCLFRRNVVDPEQLGALVADLRGTIGPHALIAIDQEGGGVWRVPFWPAAPSAMCLGAGFLGRSCDLSLVREVGEAVGRPLAAAGINWNFAPVLDLNTNPRNPVIGDRAFGADGEVAAELALAWLGGLHAAGVAGCVKHFPGHGDTHLDSHHDLPTVSRSRAELDSGELRPFSLVLGQQPTLPVMTSHIVYPALDPGRPATLSEPVLGGLLRGEWGHRGVIVTDSMGMQAIDGRYGREEAAVLALRAGADLVMALGRRSVQERTAQAIAGALAEGKVPGPGERVNRLRALAQSYPSSPQPWTPTQQRMSEEVLDRAWQAGLTAWREPARPRPSEPALLIVERGAPGELVSEAGLSGEAVAAALRPFFPLETVLTDHPEEIDWARLRLQGRPLWLATTTRRRSPGWVGAAPDLHLALWNPYAVLDVDAPALITYGSSPGALRALTRWLTGKGEAGGRFPG